MKKSGTKWQNSMIALKMKKVKKTLTGTNMMMTRLILFFAQSIKIAIEKELRCFIVMAEGQIGFYC